MNMQLEHKCCFMCEYCNFINIRFFKLNQLFVDKHYTYSCENCTSINEVIISIK